MRRCYCDDVAAAASAIAGCRCTAAKTYFVGVPCGHYIITLSYYYILSTRLSFFPRIRRGLSAILLRFTNFRIELVGKSSDMFVHMAISLYYNGTSSRRQWRNREFFVVRNQFFIHTILNFQVQWWVVYIHYYNWCDGSPSSSSPLNLAPGRRHAWCSPSIIKLKL